MTVFAQIPDASGSSRHNLVNFSGVGDGIRSNTRRVLQLPATSIISGGVGAVIRSNHKTIPYISGVGDVIRSNHKTIPHFSGVGDVIRSNHRRFRNQRIPFYSRAVRSALLHLRLHVKRRCSLQQPAARERSPLIEAAQ